MTTYKDSTPSPEQEERDKDVLLTMSDEYKNALMQASHSHQSFIEMAAQKGRFDAKQAAQCVEYAENIYTDLLNKDPTNPIVRYQLATLYMQTNRNGLAINVLEFLIQTTRKPALEWVNNLGAAYRHEHMNKEARKAFEKALGMEYHPDVLANLCALWVNEGYPEKGIPYGKECLRTAPSHPQGSWNLGLLLLEDKQYEEGFKHYANGFETGERIIRYYKDKDGKEAKFWKGEDLNGKTIVLHGEQGIGDELLFLQFVPELKKQYPDARIVLDVHPRLYTAIQRSMPSMQDVFPTRKSKTTPEWNDTIRIDYKDGLGSLPRWYHLSRRINAGWLKPNSELTEFYRKTLRKMQEQSGQIQRPIVGIAWSGGRKKTRVDLRSIPLEDWLPILEQDATFVSLEYWKDAESTTGKMLKDHGVYVHHWPDVVENSDYEHSMALAAACDLVICVNTSMVHVRGSMNLPCWTLTPHGHAWRYGKKDTLNPFYNSVTQYHQNDGEEWEFTIKKVAKDLAKYCRGFK
jgi:tetratricopeptide (TPR) repeat protein